jgi:hypothetical protein
MPPNAKPAKSLLLLAVLLLHVPASGIDISEMASPGEIEKIEAIRSMRSVSRLEMGGLSGTTEAVFVAPDKVYTYFDLGILQFTQAFDGERAWIKDQNDQVLEVTGPEKNAVVSGTYMTGMSYFRDDGMVGEEVYLGDTTIDNQAYFIFAAVPEHGDSLILYFNKGTRRLEISEETLDELEIVTFFSDFREVGGIEFPFKAVSKSPIPQFSAVIEIAEIEINVPVDESLFRMEVDEPEDFYFPEGVDSVNVPFIFYGGHLFVKGGVNGNKVVEFILDSGAGSNVIDSSYAAEIGLEVAGDLPAKGIAGYGSAALAELDSLNVGQIAFFSQMAAVIDLAGSNLRLPGKLGGILGYSLLSRFPFKLDYAAGRVTFYSPHKFIPPDSVWGVDIEFCMKAPIVPADYGDIRGDFLIDLGNPAGLVLHGPFVAEHNLKETFTDIQEMRAGFSGIGGYSNTYAAVGAGFKIGAIERKSLPLIVAEAETGVVESKKIDGNIGNLFLQDFSIIMDYANKKMYILPAEK